MIAATKLRLSPAEYLARENASARKHEYVNGEVIAMAGGSPRHNLISANIIVALGTRLGDGPCCPMTSDQRVHVPDTGLYTYPDVTVVCGEPEPHPDDRNTIGNPRVIFEVLSNSTEAHDRGAKFSHYRRSATLAEYVLVSQRERLVEHYRRTDDGRWILSEYRGDDTVELPSLGCRLPLHEIYRNADRYPADTEDGAS